MNDREPLGSYLRRERESRNISLKEVAKTIRVRGELLRALEEDRYDLLPPHPYLKGFLFNYAKVVGLDPHEVVLRYENALQVKPTLPPEVLSKKKPTKKPEEKPGKKFEKKILWSPRQVWIIGGVVALSVILSLLFLFPPPKPSVGPGSPKPEVSLPTEDTIQQQEEQKLPSPPPSEREMTQPLPSVPFAQEAKALSLTLRAVEKTWVRIQLDDRPEKEMTLQPGEGITHRAKGRIHLLVGNAGGLDLTLNGKPLEKFGQSGEVVTLIITPQGVETKPSEKVKPVGEE